MNHYKFTQNLRHNQLFSCLDKSDFAFLIQHSTIKKITAGNYIFHEKEQALHYYFINSGRVDLFRWSPAGNEVIYQVINNHQVLIAPAILSEKVYHTMNARAHSQLEIIYLQRSQLNLLCAKRPQLTMRIMSLMADELSHAINRIDQLSMNNAGQRLVSYLGDLQMQQQAEFISLPVNLSVLARQIAITPETLSRLLKKFRQHKYIHCQEKTLSILDINALYDFVGLPYLGAHGQTSSQSSTSYTDAKID